MKEKATTKEMMVKEKVMMKMRERKNMFTRNGTKPHQILFGNLSKPNIMLKELRNSSKMPNNIKEILAQKEALRRPAGKTKLLLYKQNLPNSKMKLTVEISVLKVRVMKTPNNVDKKTEMKKT